MNIQTTFVDATVPERVRAALKPSTKVGLDYMYKEMATLALYYVRKYVLGRFS